MKKAAAFIVLGLLAGCGSGESDPDTISGIDVVYDGTVATDTAGTDTAGDVPHLPDTGECAITTSQYGFMDLCDGTVRDTNTGLVWEKSYGESGTTVNDVKRYCNGLKLGYNGGNLYDDWRAPTIDELRTLIVGCDKTALDGACELTHACNKESCLGVDPYYAENCKCGNNGGPVEFPDDDPEDEFETWCYMDGSFEPWCNLYYSQTYVPKGTTQTDRLVYVQFYDGKVGTIAPNTNNGTFYVKCVRGQSSPQIPCVTSATDNTPGCGLE